MDKFNRLELQAIKCAISSSIALPEFYSNTTITNLNKKIDSCIEEWEPVINETGEETGLEIFMRVNKYFETEDYTFSSEPANNDRITVSASDKIVTLNKGDDIVEVVDENELPEIRVCGYCGKPMQNGNVLDNGDDYACNDCFPFMMDNEYGSNRWGSTNQFEDLFSGDELGQHYYTKDDEKLLVNWYNTDWSGSNY